MRRWKPALIGAATLAALLVPAPAATADPTTPRATKQPGATKQPRPAASIGHSKIKAPARGAAADHTVTIRGIDIDGTPVAPLAGLIDPATGAEYPLTQSGDTLTALVPAGTYDLSAIVLTGDPANPRDLALYGNPALSVSADVDVTMDARTATEIKAVSPSATATEVVSHAELTQTIAGQQISSIITGTPQTSLRAWPSSTTTRPYHFLYVESQSEPLTTQPAPRVYNLAFPTAGRIPSTLTFTAAPSSLALVNTTYASQGVPSGGVGPHATIVDFDGINESVVGLSHAAAAPSTQRIYYTADGVTWKGNYFYQVGTTQIAERHTGWQNYAPGATYSETWNGAAFGPTMKTGHGQGLLLARPLIADTGTPGHENFGGNYSEGTPGTLTLYRNGQLVGQSTNPLAGDWNVPAEAATYRLDLSLQRSVPWSKYVSSVNASWTFPSAERPGDPFEDQRGLLQPRITGNYDNTGRAPSGVTFPLDVVVERAAGGSAVSTASLEASFNDGATWTTVPLTPNGTDRWTANVSHPTTHNGYVALRFKATDASGNAVQQTVTRAYGLS
ncbi:hypothetical protein E1264_34265 [Actinomadura sp. KC216]|uniref:hypothetical protein n=1 Tax=Actinomadura sp. KC216 TaxID=2530370 RepID=UPI0010487F02|nr:hypothetical protein [Actinomadura sp. KC216]TDB80336.1 hypothetical protein E1264_34265 [Actinomadura sp. KC216]